MQGGIFGKMRPLPQIGDQSDEDLYGESPMALALKRKSRAAFIKRILMQSDEKDILKNMRVANSRERALLGEEDNEHW